MYFLGKITFSIIFSFLHARIFQLYIILFIPNKTYKYYYYYLRTDR